MTITIDERSHVIGNGPHVMNRLRRLAQRRRLEGQRAHQDVLGEVVDGLADLVREAHERVEEALGDVDLDR